MGLFNSTLHMGPDDASGKRRIDFLVDVFTAALVFNKVFRIVHLSDVVVVGTDAGKKRICSDLVACSLGKRSHHEGMVVCSACSDKHFLHERIVQIAEVHKAEHRRRVENKFKRRKKSKTENA